MGMTMEGQRREEVEFEMKRKQDRNAGAGSETRGVEWGFSLPWFSPDLTSLTGPVLFPSPCCACLVSPLPVHSLPLLI